MSRFGVCQRLRRTGFAIPASRDHAMRHVVLGSFICLVASCATPAWADLVETKGRVKEVNVDDRTLVLVRTRGTTEKRVDLEVSAQALIKVGDSTAELAAIKVGDEVAVTYDSTLEVVTRITKDGGEKNYAKLLRVKFAASKATLDPNTGLLTLAYDFSKPSQLKDFDTTHGSPELLAGGVMKVPAAESVGHVVRFKDVVVTGVFKVRDTADYTDMLGLTNGAVLGKHQWQNEFRLKTDGKEAVTPTAPSPSYAMRLVCDGRKVRVQINKAELGLPCSMSEPVGVVFHGGQGGSAVGGLIIAGTPDPAWFARFMEQ